MSDFPYETVKLNEDNVSLLDTFCCGDNEIDRYIKEDALNDKVSGKGVTYLVIDNNRNGKLVAYYTLCATSLLYFTDKDIANKGSIEELEIRGISSIELKMFAVNESYQDEVYKDEDYLISDIILGSVIGFIYELAIENLGIQMIILYSVPNAVDFYERNGFLPLDDYISLYDDYIEGCTPMYMRLFD